MTTTLINVQDITTLQPISSAQVFINGVGVGSTNSSGNLTISLGGGTFPTISIKASSYQLYSGSLNVGIANNIFMQLAPVQTTFPFNLIVNPEAPAVGTIFTFSNNGSPISATYTTGGVSVTGLSSGQQTVTASINGYLDINQVFDVSTTSQGTIELTVSSDDGEAKGAQTQSIQDPNTSLILPTQTPVLNPEFVAPNTGQGTYFTITQARIYIGNLFIDELSSIQFALQDNQLPIYGYASRFWDALAQGKSLVQGQLSINFISEGYLYTALQEYTKFTEQPSPPVNKIASQQQQRMTTLTNSLQNPDPAWTPDMIANAKKEVQNLAAALGPTSIQTASSQINAINKSQQNNVLGLPGGDYSNPVYVNTSFDIVIQYSGAGRTITRRLEQCKLISNESVLDHSGTPILDSYGFIARRLR